MTDLSETIRRVRELLAPWDNRCLACGWTLGDSCTALRCSYVSADRRQHVEVSPRDLALLADECERLRRALEDIASYEEPTFGEVALQVCRDMRDDAFDALKGTR